jgi:hypothetical protein
VKLRAITSLSFAQALEAAGLVDDIDRVHEIRIIANSSSPVMIEVDYFGDERLFSLAKPASPVVPHEAEEAKG